MQKAKSNRAALALAVVAALGLGACSSSHDEPSTRPNQPSADTQKKQKQFSSELEKAEKQLKAEKKAAQDKAFKELEAADSEQRAAKMKVLAKEWDKTTPEGKAALEKVKKDYLAAAAFELARDKALKEDERLKDIQAKLDRLEADDAKKRAADLAQLKTKYDTSTAQGKADWEKAQADYKTQADAALDAQRLAAETQNKAALAKALKQLEADAQKQNAAKLAGLEKEYDQTTAEGKAALAAAKKKADVEFDHNLTNLKK